MVDLHSHILPGLDDGARSEEEALQMARQAAADGVREIVATPHTHDGIYQNEPSRILGACNHLGQLLEQHQIPIKLHPGAEVHIQPDLPEQLKRKKLLTIGRGGRFLLLELPVVQLPLYTERVLNELADSGVTPIIAHPERCLTFQDNPYLLKSWMRKYGIVCQITSGSLVGQMGKKIQRQSTALIRHGVVHLLASDSHDCAHRLPSLSKAFAWLERHFPQAVEPFQQNARRVLEGEQPQPVEPAACAGGWRHILFHMPTKRKT